MSNSPIRPISIMSNNSNYFQSFFDNNLYGILELDKEGAITKANGVFEEFLNWPVKEILGLSVSQLMHQKDGELFSKKHLQFNSGKVDNYELEVRFRKKSGKMLHTSIAVTPVIEKVRKEKTNQRKT